MERWPEISDHETNGEEMQTPGERIEQLIQRAQKIDREAGKTQHEQLSWRKLGQIIGVSTGTPSNWKRAETIKPQHLKAIAEVFRERYDMPVKWTWLRDGDMGAPPASFDAAMGREISRLVREICEQEGWPLPSFEDLLEVVGLVYRESVLMGQVDPESVRHALRVVIKR